MAGRVVLFLSHGAFEPAYQAASIAITAAAMGDEVYLVFAFDALRQLARRSFGLAHTEKESGELQRGDALGVPTPAKMLSEARSLGVRLVCCDTTAKLCGLSAGELTGTLDQVMGLPSIWRLTEGARVLSF